MYRPSQLGKTLFIFIIVNLFSSHNVVNTVELTFELPDSQKQCFHEEIQQDTKSTIEFQVVTGGLYDVDCSLQSPAGQVLYRGVKKQSDSYTFKAEDSGVYRLCFSNEFSTFSHKLIYLDWTVGEENPLPGIGHHLTAMTKLETSCTNLHGHLTTINDYQTHHRLMETQGRRRSESLNSRVMYFSLGETVLIVVISVSQVLILRNFFSEKKTSST